MAKSWSCERNSRDYRDSFEVVRLKTLAKINKHQGSLFLHSSCICTLLYLSWSPKPKQKIGWAVALPAPLSPRSLNSFITWPEISDMHRAAGHSTNIIILMKQPAVFKKIPYGWFINNYIRFPLLLYMTQQLARNIERDFKMWEELLFGEMWFRKSCVVSY